MDTALCDYGGHEINLEVMGKPYECTTCGRSLCTDCTRFHESDEYCPDHVPNDDNEG